MILMNNKFLPRIQYWTKWRTAIELVKFIVFLVLEILVLYILLIELLAIFGGNGLPFNLPSNIPSFRF